jgi:predicted acylesterase/phospholipase RssA
MRTAERIKASELTAAQGAQRVAAAHGANADAMGASLGKMGVYNQTFGDLAADLRLKGMSEGDIEEKLKKIKQDQIDQGVTGKKAADGAQQAQTDMRISQQKSMLALQAMINREVKNRTIEQMRMPLGVVATDLQSGKGVLFRSGNTGIAVRASCSIPGVFQPTTIQGREYVDGGLVAPVPVQYAKQMGATVVIAVSISNEPGQQNASGTLGVLQQTISIMQQSINSYELQSADIVIQPKLHQMGGADFKARSAAILAGEIATQEKMAQIKALIGV